MRKLKGNSRGRNRRPPKPVNADGTLVEMSSRDVWQAELITRDEKSAGRVVREVVEPSMYTVRYLIVYRPEEERHVLLPATSVQDILAGAVACTLSAAEIGQLPTYGLTEITRCDEKAIYDAADRTPHWIEEAGLHDR